MTASRIALAATASRLNASAAPATCRRAPARFSAREASTTAAIPTTSPSGAAKGFQDAASAASAKPRAARPVGGGGGRGVSAMPST